MCSCILQACAEGSSGTCDCMSSAFIAVLCSPLWRQSLGPPSSSIYIQLDLGPAPAVGDGRPTSVACAQRWDLGPAMVLLKRATHRPRPGALRPKSMLSAGPAVFFRVGLPMEAAPPR